MRHVEAAIAAMTTSRSWETCRPPRCVTDRGKVVWLALEMATRGWNGPPVVVAGDQGLTGTHRLAAIAHSGLIDLPVVDAHAVGRRWVPGWSTTVEDWRVLGQLLGEHLPADVVTYLGLDLHLPEHVWKDGRDR